jgi:hypothetical protein
VRGINTRSAWKERRGSDRVVQYSRRKEQTPVGPGPFWPLNSKKREREQTSAKGEGDSNVASRATTTATHVAFRGCFAFPLLASARPLPRVRGCCCPCCRHHSRAAAVSAREARASVRVALDGRRGHARGCDAAPRPALW